MATAAHGGDAAWTWGLSINLTQSESGLFPCMNLEAELVLPSCSLPSFAFSTDLAFPLV